MVVEVGHILMISMSMSFRGQSVQDVVCNIVGGDMGEEWEGWGVRCVPNTSNQVRSDKSAR